MKKIWLRLFFYGWIWDMSNLKINYLKITKSDLNFFVLMLMIKKKKDLSLAFVSRYRESKWTKIFAVSDMWKLQNSFDSGRSNWNVSCGCFASSNNSSPVPNADLIVAKTTRHFHTLIRNHRRSSPSNKIKC